MVRVVLGTGVLMNRITIMVLILMAASVGCGPFQSRVAFNEDSKNIEKPNYDKTRPQCEISYYDFRIDTHLISFEMIDKKGFRFGFNLISNFMASLGLALDVKKSEMSFVMDVFQTHNYLASIEGKVDGKETGFTGKIGYNGINLGYESFSRLPVSKLTRQGLLNTLGSVSRDLDSRVASGRLNSWSTRVLKKVKNSQSKVIIQAGSESGLIPGDELAVYHMTHEWSGEPCDSEYLGWSLDSETPVTYLKVTDTIKNSTNYSIVDITDPHITNDKIELGDYVVVHKLVSSQKPRKALAQTVKIGQVTSGKFIVDNKEIDLSDYIQKQIRAVIVDPALNGKFNILSEKP